MNSYILAHAGLTLLTLSLICALTAVWIGDCRWGDTAGILLGFALLLWVAAGITAAATDDNPNRRRR